MREKDSSMKIAIDGPAGAGKSTVARAVAAENRISIISILGRCTARLLTRCLRRGLSRNVHRRSQALPEMDMKVIYETGMQKVLVGGKDVTPFIRTPRISRGRAISLLFLSFVLSS